MKRINGKFFSLAFRKAAERLLANKDEINALNVFPVPDGDTGSNMSAAMIEACSYLDKLTENDMPSVLNAVKTGMLMGARGNSGVILSQIFRGFSDGISSRKSVNTKAFTEALGMAKEVAYKSVIKPVEGTMLTVIRVMADRAKEELDGVEDFETYFDSIVDIAMDTVNKTPGMLAKLREAGVVDAGAKGLAYIFEGFKLVASGSTEVDLSSIEGPQTIGSSAERIVEMVREELKFTYCTEIIVKLHTTEGKEDTCSDIKAYLEEMGDSIVMVNQDDFIKVHVHTDHPGQVIESFVAYGDLQKIKVDNMKLQHEHVVQLGEPKKEVYGEEKNHGIVAISPGEGLSEIMKSLGADYIVTGGQTMNPSIKDLLEAMRRMAPEKVIVLPNNPNILLTAKEAANTLMEEDSNRKIFILPTKTVQEGITVLTSFNDELETDDLIDEMNSAIDNVIPLSVTYAVRESSIKGKKVRKGEYLAIGKSDLISSGRKLDKVVMDAIKNAVKLDTDKEVVTIFYGSEVKEETAVKLSNSLNVQFPDLEFEVYKGDQPYYYYLISVE